MASQELVIAAYGPWSVTVLDVRNEYEWSRDFGTLPTDRCRDIFLHHTATKDSDATEVDELEYLRFIAESAPYRLPYNFVLFNHAPHRVYYVNDVDTSRAHTYGHNDDCAICVVGNFERIEPQHETIHKLRDLILALRAMWFWCPMNVHLHSQVSRTACPGRLLRDAARPLVTDAKPTD